MRLGPQALLLRLVERHEAGTRVTRARRERCEQVVEALVAGLNAELTGGDVAQAAHLPQPAQVGGRGIADASALVEPTGLLWRHRQRRVPERLEQWHGARVPDAGGDDTARPRDARHLADTSVPVVHELHDKLAEH